MLFAESYSLQSVPCIMAARTFSWLCSLHITNLLHPYNFVTNLANVLPMHNICCVLINLMLLHEIKCPLNIMEHHDFAAMVRIPPGAWISASCECFMFSCRGLCWLITHPEEFYCILCVRVWLWSLIMRRPWPTRGCCATEKKRIMSKDIYCAWSQASAAK
jgi:hypothetical protein